MHESRRVPGPVSRTVTLRTRSIDKSTPGGPERRLQHSTHERARTHARWFAIFILLLCSRWAYAQHPTTLFDGAGLERLQVARSTTHAELAAALRAAVQSQQGAPLVPGQFGDERLLGNVLAGDAVAAVVLDDASIRALARQNLLAALAWPDWGFGDGDDLTRAHLIIGVAIAYDVLWPVLSSAERTQVRTRLGTEAQRFDTAAANGIWWSRDWLQNHNWINFGALGLAGFALQGEDARATGWIARARANSVTLRAVLDLISDGSWHEGVAYQQYGWSFAMPFWIASERAGVTVSDHAMLKSYGAYRLWTQLPDLPQGYVTTHGDWTGWAGPGSTQILRYAAQRFRDGFAQEAARRWLAGTRRSTRAEDTFYLALEYVAFDPAVAPIDPNVQPTDFHAADQGAAVLRSGWGAGSTVLGFKAGVLGGRANWERLRTNGAPGGNLNISHDHMDDLGVWMYGDGQWLLPECVGYNIGRTSGPKAWMTEFHNALLVNGAGQLGDDRGANDNGLSHPWFFQRESHLDFVRSTDGYGFARGDGTRLYPAAAGVRSMRRFVALSREGWAILRDEIELGAALPVEQVLHALDAATVDGAWVRANSKNDRVLGVRIVSPGAPTIAIAAQTADKLSKQFDTDGSVSSIRIRPAAAASSNRFVTLLWPTRGARWASRPNVQPLDPARPEAGLSIPTADGTESWVFAPDDGVEVIAGRLSTNAAAATLREGVNGTVDGAALAGPGQVSLAGRLVLASAAPGALELRIDGSIARLSGAESDGIVFFGPGITRVVLNGRDVSWHREGDRVRLGALAGEPDGGAPDAVDGGTPGNGQDPGPMVPDGSTPTPPVADAGEDPVDAGVEPPVGDRGEEATSADGGPIEGASDASVVVSWGEDAATEPPARAPERRGCGCANGGEGLGVLAVVLGLVRRQRKARCTNQ